MVIGEDERQVRITRRQNDFDLVRRGLRQFLDRLEDTFGGRLCLTAMKIDRVDDVVSVKRLARPKCDALSNIECPFQSTRLGLPALGKLRRSISLGVNFNQCVPEHQAVSDWN